MQELEKIYREIWKNFCSSQPKRKKIQGFSFKGLGK